VPQSQQQQIEYAATKEDALAFALGAAEQFLLALEHATAIEKKELRSQAKLALDKADQIKKCDLWNPAPLIDFGNPIDRTSKGKNVLNSLSSIATETASAAPSTPPQHTGREPARANSTSPDLLIDLTPEPAQPRKGSQSLLPFSPKKDTSKNGTPKLDTQKLEAPKLDMPKLDTPKLDTPKLDTPKLDTPKLDTPKLDTPKKVAQLKVPVSTRRRTRKEEIILLKSSAVHGFKFPPWEDNPPSTEFEQRGATERFRYV
jgi:hypothetical protein